MPFHPGLTAFATLSKIADEQPDRTAVIAGDRATTYAGLAARAARLAEGMVAHGLAQSPIGLLANNRIEWLEVFFAASACGAELVPISTWSTPAELDFILSDSGVGSLFAVSGIAGQDFVAATEASAARRSTLQRLVLIGGPDRSGWDRYEALCDGPLAIDPSATRPAAAGGIILYTSGSSNRPKAVPLDDATSMHNGFHIGERQGLRPGDRVLISIPLFWSYGAANALPAVLSHAATMVLQGRFEPGEALDLIERHRCTGIYTLPAMTSALLAHRGFGADRTRSLRTGVTIGAPQDVVKAATDLGIGQICNIYGSTETYGNCCVTPHDWPLERRSTCQGPPLPGVVVRIRNAETGDLCQPGEVGQIEVSGPFLTRGYRFDSARHNGDVFTPEGAFRTGDLGSLNADGTLVYAGRSSEMMKRSGINVSPAEVEEVLQQHASVGLAGVTGAPDAVKGDIIVAFVVAKAGARIDTAELLAHCRGKLSRYKIPDRIEVRDALPLTPTGKLLRRELKALAVRA